ncbi:hypothetical protein COT78_04105 [Candidatus Berkelbacteria bacterium CG10_big_fil_rev_8_21_14_0_10_43_13]|uniref:Regulatory protein RecX n=1 Tax=Candidatus Berkelbacteria bacterium CG10_big_fil_rev_8_21_14_0_10_43_13 TaxID=1974514 RepID=A0A2H0W5F4_9BACT|nr:MAG: hypothetical protein COT78_04105 [Candidatus Berkelbacteria bacterium CG10_big_fil_rev_8_21_14_0_10_43_13]
MKKKPLECALYLLELRDRTEGEIRDKMRMKKYEPAEIDSTIQFLTDKDFINDERFVKNLIRNNTDFGTKGKYKIRQKLIQLKVPADLIEQNLNGIDSDDELQRATELAEKWLAKQRNILPEKRYEKLGRHLISRGYEWDIVKDVMEKLL